MNLLDLLGKTAGTQSLDEVAGAIGIDAGSAASIVAAIQPALTRAVSKQAASGEGLDAFRRALESGNHQRYVEDPSLLRQEATREEGNAILGHLFGSKDVSRNVAAKAAAETGIDANLIKQALPLVASLAMGAMSKETNAGRDMGASAAAGGLGPLGALIDSDGDGVDLDDVLGLARRFF
jgi:hypothetical protein